MPLEYYKYPESKAEWVGIPVAEGFKPVGVGRQKELKKMFGYDVDRPLVMIAGGSLGSRHINEAVREILSEINKVTNVGLIAGRARYEEMADLKEKEVWEDGKFRGEFRMWEFSSATDEFFGAADVVVSRAGATTLAELAMLKKAVVLVPNPMLPGSHQVKNAEMLEKSGAVVVVDDETMVEQPGVLLKATVKLVKDKEKREELAAKLHEFAKPEAAKRLAEVTLDCVKSKKIY
jgi:UDP-N-acetylglucosamine--N-acetylmuramyl-(pentapeptide) pyrophosphoryl-undecaprenol N-acetylglucosamine transferase